jgi:uncharacterized protein YqeY
MSSQTPQEGRQLATLASDIRAPEVATQSDPSLEDEDLQVVDELNRRRREEAETEEEEIDRETDSELEAAEVNLIGGHLKYKNGCSRRLLKELRELWATQELEKEEREQRLERLESFLRRFQETD